MYDWPIFSLVQIIAFEGVMNESASAMNFILFIYLFLIFLFFNILILAGISTSFFLWLSNIPSRIYHILFIHSSTDGHLGCFGYCV